VTWALFFDTGEIAVIETMLVVGREPTASTRNERLLAIDDPARSVSRAHFCVELTAAGPVVEDRGSSNGTAIVRNHQLIDVRIGDRTLLLDGDEVLFGDRRAKVHRR